MPTLRQRKVAKLIIENATLDKPLNGGQIVEKGRYSKSMVIKPSKVLESKGVKDALAEYGLTEELITSSLVSDIENKPKNRLGELRLGAEILKMNEREGGENKTLVLVVTSETAERYGIKPTHNSENSSSR